MNKYETVIIINSKITKEQKREVINKVEGYISSNGNITSTEDLGTRKLAYEVRKQKEADYYVINFECDADKIAELERIYRITDEIIKFIVVRRDDENE